MCLPINEVDEPVGGKVVKTVKLLSEFFFQDGFGEKQVENSSFLKMKNNNFIVEIEYYYIGKKSGKRCYY